MFMQILKVMPLGLLFALNSVPAFAQSNSATLEKNESVAKNLDANSAAQIDLRALEREALSVRKIGNTLRFRYLPNPQAYLPSVREDVKKSFPLFGAEQMKSVLGPGNTGGIHAYFNGSMKHLRNDVDEMIFKFDRLPERLLQSQIPPRFRNKFSAKDVANALRNVRYSYFQSGMSVAPDGQIDELQMDWIDSPVPHVVVLSNFFNTYNTAVNKPEDEVARRVALLHEITHLFGIGVLDDFESADLAWHLERVLLEYNFRCQIGSRECYDESLMHFSDSMWWMKNERLQDVDNIKKEFGESAKYLGTVIASKQLVCTYKSGGCGTYSGGTTFIVLSLGALTNILSPRVESDPDNFIYKISPYDNDVWSKLEWGGNGKRIVVQFIQSGQGEIIANFDYNGSRSNYLNIIPPPPGTWKVKYEHYKISEKELDEIQKNGTGEMRIMQKFCEMINREEIFPGVQNFEFKSTVAVEQKEYERRSNSSSEKSEPRISQAVVSFSGTCIAKLKKNRVDSGLKGATH